MQFIDLETQQGKIRNSIEANIRKVLDHGQYIMGPEVKELEKKLADFVGMKCCIGCSSGTDALLMALMALSLGPGDAVITTPFTFVATAEAIALTGAVPIFADIDQNTFNIAPAEIEKIMKAIKLRDNSLPSLPRNVSLENLKIKGIIAVDLFGLPADYDEIRRIALENDLFVIADAAQSFGSEYLGRKACACADVACTSFFPAKPLGAYGDAGAVFTNDEDLYQKMLSIRIHGQGVDKYNNVRIGLNARLDTLQAAVLLSKLELFPSEIEERQRVAQQYSRNLQSLPKIKLQEIPKGYKSVWAQYSIKSGMRKEILSRLSAHGIPSAIYYPMPLHLQQAFGFLGYSPGDMPVSETISQEIFSLPMHPYLENSQIKVICEIISACFE